jgi:hypothetical protein
MTMNRRVSAILALIVLPGIAARPAAAQGGPAQPYALLCERGRTFRYEVTIETEENDKVSKRRKKVQIQVQSAEVAAGATLVELRTTCDGKPGGAAAEGLFSRRLLGVTPRGVYDFGGKKPDAGALARALKRKPKWPAQPPNRECVADEEDINTAPEVDGGPDVTYRAGSAGTATIAGRRAVCRCRVVNSPQSVEEEECLDRERGFVRFTYHGQDAGVSTTKWTMTLVDSVPGTPRSEPAPAPTPARVGPKETSSRSAPPIDLRPVAADAAEAAKKLNAAGLRQHNARNYPEAIKLFTKALVTNPGHLLARYNLACAYNRSGQGAMALALLRQLREKNTPACEKILRQARKDKDLESLASSDAFKKVTAPAR